MCVCSVGFLFFFFSSRRRHTRLQGDWSSDVCSSDLTVFPTSKTDLPLPIQGTVKFQVQALAADKSPVPEAPFRWTVGDTSLASFDPASGTLTGKRAGKTTLVVKGPGPGLVVTWQIRVIAA